VLSRINSPVLSVLALASEQKCSQTRRADHKSRGSEAGREWMSIAAVLPIPESSDLPLFLCHSLSSSDPPAKQLRDFSPEN